MLKHRDNKTYHQSTKINTQKCSLAEQKHNLRTFLKGGRGKTNTPAVCSSSRSISFRSSASSFLSSVGIGFSSASSTEHTRNRTRSERVSEEGGGGGSMSESKRWRKQALYRRWPLWSCASYRRGRAPWPRGSCGRGTPSSPWSSSAASCSFFHGSGLRRNQVRFLSSPPLTPAKTPGGWLGQLFYIYIIWKIFSLINTRL